MCFSHQHPSVPAPLLASVAPTSVYVFLSFSFSFISFFPFFSHLIFTITNPHNCKESDARSLRGGGGELDNIQTLTYGFTTFFKVN
jgi:hypothetical protein